MAMAIAVWLHSLFCGPLVTIQSYVTTWHTSLLQMENTGCPLDHRDAVEIFCAGLPATNQQYNNLHESLEHHVNCSSDAKLPLMDDVFNTVLDIDHTIQHYCPSVLSGNCTCPGAPTVSSTAIRISGSSANYATPSTSATQSTSTAAASSTSSKHVVCGNCSGIHPTPDCFQPRGAMEG